MVSSCRFQAAACAHASVKRHSPEPGIVRIDMCDPASKNALGPDLVGALLYELDRACHCSSTAVIVLCGLEDLFSSGASLELLDGLREGRVALAELALAENLLHAPVPIIAAARGGAIGGGFTLALAADFLVLANDRRYGFNFMQLGITPGMGTTRLAEHFLGPSIAYELMMTCELRRGRDFVGLQCNAIVASDQVESRALELARKMTMAPRKHSSMLKQVLTLDRRKAFVEALTQEYLMHASTFEALDMREFGGAS